MKAILGYISKYFYETNKLLLTLVTILTGWLIFMNYYYGIDDQISAESSFINRFTGRYVIFFIAFVLPYLGVWILNRKELFQYSSFVVLLLIAPAIFSVKAGLHINFHASADPGLNTFWHYIVYWPFLLLLVGLLLFICWRLFDADQPFYGMTARNLLWKPYWLMLILMVPLIAAASTQADFLAVYPKLNLVVDPATTSGLDWWHKLLFELSYGSDFIGIELFFRGFLVLAFLKWAGKDAILPMACFYCTIHFGKPLGECISSYFGGLLLGIVVSNTGSIWGGLMVHLGIAWLMELEGYLGRLL